MTRPRGALRAVEAARAFRRRARPAQIRGHWEQPFVGGSRHSAAAISGWAFSLGTPIRALIAELPGGSEVPLVYGLPRADVAAVFPGVAEAMASGFAGMLPSDRHGRMRVIIWAILESGQRVRCFDARLSIPPPTRPVGVLRFLETAASKAVVAFREGRLPRSPREQLRLLRLHYRDLTGAPHAASSRPVTTGSPLTMTATPDENGVPPAREHSTIVERDAVDAKHTLTALYRATLRELLDSDVRLTFRPFDVPLVTAVVVLFNRAELTLRCLRSLLETSVPLEVLIVDNASSDDTIALLEHVDGATVIRNRDNIGFLLAVNQAAARARGRFLLLLNNDAELLPGSIEAAIETLTGADDIGAVGGKILHMDGQLQEAGSIVWRDASCLGYGRRDDPTRPEYMFRRDVDFCSGAFLLTERSVFLAAGGFDVRFAPAYYEDSDYCLGLWRSGHRVVYEPRAAIVHFEFASSTSPEQALAMQAERRTLFLDKHRDRLATHLTSSPDTVLRARSARRTALRVLFIDDRVPHAFLGSGYPRARDILRALVDLGHEVTFYPLQFPVESWAAAYRDIPREAELMLGLGTAGLEAFLRERAGHYDVILVSRPHNMRVLAPFLARADATRSPAVIYDAEAIFALREQVRRELTGTSMSASEAETLVSEEVQLAAPADVIITVSEREGRHFKKVRSTEVITLGHTLSPVPTVRPFPERKGLLFVGALVDDTTPNADSVRWLVGEVLPRIRKRLGETPRLTVAGAINQARTVAALAGDGVEIPGIVADLVPLYDRSRVFVAPTRFGAGIPMKVHHAVAHGLPVVCTSLLAEQLGWKDGQELLVADSADAFAERCCALYRDAALWHRLRNGALARLTDECAPDVFRGTVSDAVAAAVARRRGRSRG